MYMCTHTHIYIYIYLHIHRYFLYMHAQVSIDLFFICHIQAPFGKPIILSPPPHLQLSETPCSSNVPIAAALTNSL